MLRAWLDEFLTDNQVQNSKLETFFLSKVKNVLLQDLCDDSGNRLTEIGNLLEEAEIKVLIETYLKGCREILISHSRIMAQRNHNIAKIWQLTTMFALTIILAIGAKIYTQAQEKRVETHNRVIKAADWQKDE